jgi:trehalose 6-phosphate phosphatase
MNPILSQEGLGALDALAAGHALLAFDFDGTLAPLVPEPGAAAIPSTTRRMLRALSLLYPCAVVSGRARADVARRVEGIPLFGLVGNRGAEPGFGRIDRSRRAQVLSWIRTLKHDLGLVPGVEIEDKGLSVAVHFRHAPARAAARAIALEVASTLDDARACRGRAVLNVVPSELPGKREALDDLVRRAGPRPVLYVGDDGSDEDAFGAAQVGVRVGRTARSAAGWYLAAQGAIDDLLRALLSARTRLDGLGDLGDRLALAVGD